MKIPIHTEGRFTFKDESTFDTDDYANNVYRVDAVKTITELIDNGIDVKEEIYNKQNLPLADYQRDFKANAVIYELKTKGTKYFSIPESYIEQYPVYDGVVMQDFLLGVNLGDLKEDTDFTALKANIKNTVLKTMGIITTPVITPSGDTFVKSQDEYTEFETMLNSKKEDTYKQTYKTLYDESQVLLSELTDRINKAEQFIIDHPGLEPPTP